MKGLMEVVKVVEFKIYLDYETKRLLEELSARTGLSQNEIIRRALQEYLKNVKLDKKLLVISRVQQLKREIKHLRWVVKELSGVQKWTYDITRMRNQAPHHVPETIFKRILKLEEELQRVLQEYVEMLEAEES